MNNIKTMPSQSISNPSWTGAQAYFLAAFCLLLGVALGYLFRGSAAPAAQAATTLTSQPDTTAQNQQRAAQAQAALEQAVPLLDAVNKNPGDYDSLVKLGNLFYDGQQFPNAAQYYERALAIHPESADVRTDVATAYWYAGNADRALAEMQISLKYRPGHPQTLFNLGWVRW